MSSSCETVRVALVGAGRIGRNHAEIVARRVPGGSTPGSPPLARPSTAG
ncbi:hypothetical protein [Rhodococcus sovatensis]|uniref:Gfo/Idh/MocA-like oxidoreductase N-terminal domain-containing protein n=1 Tax=Rhodococcus sovatensis TaxID=1805840 RepID=A0ABZ2PRK8_9NOCA